MRAVIMAGGKGTRLRPYTTLIPKPLVPLGGRYSILEIVISQLVSQGFDHITLAINHMAQLVMAYFGDGRRFGVRLDYSLEEEELSTIGPLTLLDDLPENFLVMNGDILCDLDYGAFLQRHIAADGPVTVSVCRRQQKIDFGVLSYNDAKELIAFQEKPVHEYDVSMGIFCLRRDVVAALPRGQRYGFDQLMVDGLASGLAIKVAPFDGFWLDIGRPDDYQYADEHFKEIAARLGIAS